MFLPLEIYIILWMNFIPTDKDQYKLLQLVSQIQSITSYYALCIVEHCNVMLN
jgi:hypothetical protein